jgi:hypothetical protein
VRAAVGDRGTVKHEVAPCFAEATGGRARKEHEGYSRFVIIYCFFSGGTQTFTNELY